MMISVATNNRPLTKSLLTWWAFQKPDQEFLDIDTPIEIEHIYSKKRQENEKALQDSDSLESLGNKAILEKSINIRASDYRFEDKKKYYIGFTNDKGHYKNGTKNIELRDIANTKTDFTEDDIKTRKQEIIDSFILYVKDAGLIK